MNRLVALAVAGAALAILCPVTNATTYYIEPVRLNDDYAIAGGFVSTNGDIGSLTSRDILDYRVDVSGPVPYVFSPSNQGVSDPTLSGLTATPSSLFLEMDATTSLGDNPGFLISANDSTVMNCDDCFQHIRYLNQSFPTGESRTDIEYVFREESNSLFVRADFLQDPQMRLLIATVPEPCCLTLMGWAILVGIARRGSCKRPA